MRKRGRDGTFVQTVTPEAIPDVFEEVRGLVITTVDVADALNCSTETVRQKLGELSKDGTPQKPTSRADDRMVASRERERQ